MKKSKSIAMPLLPGLPPYAVDYDSNQSGPITLQKAKDIVFAAALNGDLITTQQDNALGIVISIVSHAELEKEKARIATAILEKGMGA